VYIVRIPSQHTTHFLSSTFLLPSTNNPFVCHGRLRDRWRLTQVQGWRRHHQKVISATGIHHLYNRAFKSPLSTTCQHSSMNHVHTTPCLLALNLQNHVGLDCFFYHGIPELLKVLTTSASSSSPFLVTRKKKKADPAKVKAALDAKESTPPPSKPIRVLEKTAAEKRFEEIQKKRVCDLSNAPP